MRKYDPQADASDRRASAAEHWGNWPKDFEDWGRAEWKEFKAWSRQQDWKSGAKDIEAAARDFQRKLRETIDREASKFSGKTPAAAAVAPEAPRDPRPSANDDPKFKTDDERRAYELARKQASREAGFYVHLMWYGIVIGFLFLLNMFTSPFHWWWQWPAFGWGFGIVSHFAAVYGWDVIRQRVFEPAIQREVRAEVTKEKEVMATEKQASLDELTASFAHEIRNPIAAAKSLVQQMGEDPTSQENVEYAKVALDELQRVEKSVSHLLKYAKEEDYNFDNVNLAAILDASLTQMRSKLEAKNVSISRNYIGGPTVRADADKLRQVFTNIIDNAIDAMESNTSERHLDVAIRSTNPGHGDGDDSRQRMRHSGRQAREDFQSLLHHQADRHRAGDGNREEGGRFASRQDRCEQPRGRRHRAFDFDSAGRCGTRLDQRRSERRRADRESKRNRCARAARSLAAQAHAAARQ